VPGGSSTFFAAKTIVEVVLSDPVVEKVEESPGPLVILRRGSRRA
jgi:hypothetical protein